MDERDVPGRDGHGRKKAAAIDALLDRAVAAIDSGDRAAATALAGQVLAADEGNADAEELLTAPAQGGEIRRLTILFVDLVDSTALSTTIEPETYRLVVGRYREHVLKTVNRLGGHIGSTHGDGLLAVFGHPVAHEDDLRRAVLAGLEINRAVAKLSAQVKARFGFEVRARVGVHRGVVYLDTTQADVYGLGANLAARVCGLAAPGAVVISEAVARLVGDAFELESCPAAPVKGVAGLIDHYRVLGERPVPARVAQGPIVGRSREWQHLQASWARAQAGQLDTPGIVFCGEAGIGKSRLATAGEVLVTQSGNAVLELIGSPFHTDAGMHPVRALIERHCGIGRLTAPAERLALLTAEVVRVGLDPARLIPLLAPVLSIDAQHGYQAVPDQGPELYNRIFEAVQTYLLAWFGNDPGLVVAEDAHWFDPASLEVLGGLLGAGHGRLLVIVTGRNRDWLPDSWPANVFELQPLTEDESDELIAALNPALTPQEQATVRSRCDGLPFYIEQVVAGITEVGVPEALYEPLFARLRASAQVVPVVEAAAVIGRYVDTGLLRSVVDMNDEDLDRVVGELAAAQVLEPWKADGWRFRHELLREVAAELAPPSVRRRLHARVGDALCSVGGEPDWGLVANHYTWAERFDDAASAHQQASAAARRRGALNEARTHLGHALTQLDRCPPSPDRDRREIALRLGRGFLAGSAVSPSSPVVAPDLERCLQLVGAEVPTNSRGRTSTAQELFATLGVLTGYYTGRADLNRATQALELLRAALDQWRPGFWPRLAAWSGVLAFLRGEFADAASHLELATGRGAIDNRETETVGFLPIDPIVAARIHLALLRMVQGDLPTAENELAHAARCVEGIGFPQGPYSLAYLRFAEIWVRTEAGQLDRASALAAEMIDDAGRHGFDQWRLRGTILRTVIDALLTYAENGPSSAFSDHVSRVSELVDELRAADLNVYLPFFAGALARLLIAAERFDDARARIEEALALARETGMCFYDAELLRLLSHTRRDPAERRDDLQCALQSADRQGAHLFELRSALDDFELRGQAARSALATAMGRVSAESALAESAKATAALGAT
ncbi:adenylate/guanylate cyclase domain-containing protein [Mycobacterium asiaticum]|uniref:adenylate/guanylate cyclase domain-containing protein n=1 Tax=Mycobacterium asiaticum TaxID=1790 RepID=UPI0007F0466D|nr:adenylate/guanylate cyclase domain-containing protein [Mycobacterium asiaticum]OBJ53708.1 cyclase [Mycobacterium asiaticum]